MSCVRQVDVLLVSDVEAKEQSVGEEQIKVAPAELLSAAATGCSTAA